MQKLTKEQAVIVSAYTGVLCCEFSDMQEEVERRMGRPVWTHEFASKEFTEEIRTLFRDDFISLVPEDSNVDL